MPPLLPDPSCAKCHGKPELLQRADDTEDVILARSAHRLVVSSPCSCTLLVPWRPSPPNGACSCIHVSCRRLQDEGV